MNNDVVDVPIPDALLVEERATKALHKPKGGREDAKNTGKDVPAIENLDHVDQTSRSTIGMVIKIEMKETQNVSTVLDNVGSSYPPMFAQLFVPDRHLCVFPPAILPSETSV